MPQKSLTQLGAERQRPEAKEVILWDKNLPGFGMRVSPLGKKALIVQYRVRGTRGTPWKERQIKLGDLSFMTVAEARDLARRYKASAAQGTDLAEEKKAAEQAAESKRSADSFTFAKLVARYTAEHLAKRKPAGRAEQVRLLSRWLPSLGDKPVSEIVAADLLSFINESLKGRSNGRAEADNMVGVIRHLYTWAQKKQNDPALKSLVAVNPAAGIVRWAKINERDRVLDHHEIRLLWKSADELGWPAGPILKLLMLTAARVNEVAKMCWSELDLAGRVWNLPAERAKNGKAHIIHLSDMAMEVIAELPQINSSGWVFTMNGSLPYSNLDHLRTRVHRMMGKDVPAWQLRDIRRTAATLMAEIGVAPHVVDKILNHTTGEIRGVARIYNRFAYLPERKLALEALGRKVAMLIGRTDNVVVPLRA